jgi:hypothetical protein
MMMRLLHGGVELASHFEFGCAARLAEADRWWVNGER